jgi:hypothetical protein
LETEISLLMETKVNDEKSLNDVLTMSSGYEIELLLNASGYKGSDIDNVIPDFFANGNTKIGLVQIPTHNGPESWVLNIVIASTLVKVGDTLLPLVATDLYGWFKGRIKKLFQKKKNSDGAILVMFHDLQISCYEYYVGKEKMSDFLKELPNLVKIVDKTKGSKWIAKFDEQSQIWQLESD